MDDHAVHLWATYGSAAFYTALSGAVFWLTATRPNPIAARLSLVLGGLVLLFFGLGSLAGIGIHRHDDYWDHHLAPWPCASVFKLFDVAIMIVIVPVSWVVNLVKKWKQPYYQD